MLKNLKIAEGDKFVSGGLSSGDNRRELTKNQLLAEGELLKRNKCDTFSVGKHFNNARQVSPKGST